MYGYAKYIYYIYIYIFTCVISVFYAAAMYPPWHTVNESTSPGHGPYGIRQIHL